MANTLYLWRGAVEPAEASAAGNQLSLWRGAVEPIATVSTPGSVAVDVPLTGLEVNIRITCTRPQVSATGAEASVPLSGTGLPRADEGTATVLNVQSGGALLVQRGDAIITVD